MQFQAQIWHNFSPEQTCPKLWMDLEYWLTISLIEQNVNSSLIRSIKFTISIVLKLSQWLFYLMKVMSGQLSPLLGYFRNQSFFIGSMSLFEFIELIRFLANFKGEYYRLIREIKSTMLSTRYRSLNRRSLRITSQISSKTNLSNSIGMNFTWIMIDFLTRIRISS